MDRRMVGEVEVMNSRASALPSTWHPDPRLPKSARTGIYGPETRVGDQLALQVTKGGFEAQLANSAREDRVSMNSNDPSGPS